MICLVLSGVPLYIYNIVHDAVKETIYIMLKIIQRPYHGSGIMDLRFLPLK